MRLLTSIGFAFVVPALVIAQVPSVYNEALTPLAAAQYLAGENITISNASFTGVGSQMKRFFNGANKLGAGMDDGLMLATCDASFVHNPNCGNNPECATEYLVDSEISDPDLDDINGDATTREAAALEFDVSTTGTSLSFSYVFASNEYNEWVGSSYNDAFGFFISGPEINGSFSNNAMNIATVGGEPVSVNTINPNENADFYIFNEVGPNSGQNVNDEFTWIFAFDGQTTVLTATVDVLCNTNYHVKIAIANAADEWKQSAVFLKHGTLSSPYGQPGPLTILPQPVCEGDALTLSVEGEASWLYTWSTGQSGVGMQQITTTASTNIDDYSVTVQYLPRCSLTTLETQGRAVVHALNNSPPICSSDDLYIQAEHQLSVSMPSSDASNENVFVTDWSGAPGSYSVIPGQFQQGHFSWIPGEADIGFHTVQFTFTDNNACGTLQSTCLFNIKVMCRYCPSCVYYENRSPSGLPLPELTIAGACIVAGTDVDDSQTNGPVETGNASVTFKAPVITLEPGFTGGPGFVAIPDLNTCVVDCEECCAESSGITVDEPLANVFTPNGDGVNDVWQVTDQLHPYCAYNANAFDLWIYSGPWGNNVVAHRSGEGYCCPFVSKAPGVNVVSSINWDGRAGDNLLCNDCWVPDGVYMYVLEIENLCGETEDYAGYVHLLDGHAGSGMALEQTGAQEIFIGPQALIGGDSTLVLRGNDKEVVARAEAGVARLTVYPNPTNDEVLVRSTIEVRTVVVRDALGRRLLHERYAAQEVRVDLSGFASGNYQLLIVDALGSTHLQRITKQ